MLNITQCAGGWAALQEAIAAMAAKPEVRGVMVLACESNGEVPASFDRFLQQLTVKVFGGIFPALIADGVRLDRGSLVLGLEVDLEVFVVPTLSDPVCDYDALLNEFASTGNLDDLHTMFVFVDGLAPRVGSLIESLFNAFGLQGNFIGGGAGSLAAPEFRCLLTASGVIRDAAVIAVPKLASHVCVAHGWSPLAGPFEVTESDNNVILALDWEPALGVYRQVIASQMDCAFDMDQFARIAASHPFGIARLNAEFVVRDPVAVRDDGGLVCVGSVPRGSMVYVMQGNIDSLLGAAEKVRRMANAGSPAVPGKGVDIFIDCISRALFMGEEIGRELRAALRPGRAQIGAFTLGEVANSEREYLEFHNKTAVVATLWESP